MDNVTFLKMWVPVSQTQAAWFYIHGPCAQNLTVKVNTNLNYISYFILFYYNLFKSQAHCFSNQLVVLLHL